MMTLKNFLALTALSLAFGTVSAQTEEAALPRKVSNVEVLDLEGKPVTLPYWGEKNLMIFYVDPDHHKQNEDFTVELEKNHRAVRWRANVLRPTVRRCSPIRHMP